MYQAQSRQLQNHLQLPMQFALLKLDDMVHYCTIIAIMIDIDIGAEVIWFNLLTSDEYIHSTVGGLVLESQQEKDLYIHTDHEY